MARTKETPRRKDSSDAASRERPRLASAAKRKRRMRPGMCHFVDVCSFSRSVFILTEQRP